MTSPTSPTPTVGSTIDLGPDLPVTVYHAGDRWHPERIGALALYCSDGRWGEAFDEFCHKHLHIPRYDRWAVPGGPAWLAGRGDNPALLQAAHHQLDFLVEMHQLEQIVLITHFGCAMYSHELNQEPRACLPLQLQDLRLATATLQRWYPSIHIEAYLAMRNEHWLSFHEVQTGTPPLTAL